MLNTTSLACGLSDGDNAFSLHVEGLGFDSLLGNNIKFDSKPRKVRNHFLIWDYY